jgi:hypothetical protein
MPPELTVFPNGDHDDQADSTAQFLDWFKTPFPNQSIFEYYRRLAEAAEQPRKPQPTKTVYAIGSMECSPSRNNRAEPWRPSRSAIPRRRSSHSARRWLRGKPQSEKDVITSKIAG